MTAPGTSISRPSILLLVAALIAGTFGIGAAPPAGAVGTGSISGTVQDSNGPAVDVWVEACLWDATEGWCDDWYGAYTSEVGDYSIGGLPAGEYRVSFDVWDGVHASEWYNDQPTEASATPVPVTEGAAVGDVDAELAVGGTISGTVEGSSGPIGDAYVDACLWDDVDEQCVTWFTGDTDAAGSYSIGGLPAGDYKVGFFPWGGVHLASWFDGQLDEASADSVQVTAGESKPGINAMLVEASTISGTLTLSEALPERLSGVSIDVVDTATDGLMGREWMDESGVYTVGGLRSGSYRVEFARDSGPAFFAAQFYDGVLESAGTAAATPVALGEADDRLDVDAALVTGGTISGTLQDSTGAPLACYIQAWDPNEELVTRGAYSDPVDGSFEIGGLSDGDYLLTTGNPAAPTWDNGVTYDDCMIGQEFAAGVAGGDMVAQGGAAPVAATLGGAVVLGAPLEYNTVVQMPISSVDSETGSVISDPDTGYVTVGMPWGEPSDITLTIPVECAGEGVLPTAATLHLGDYSDDGIDTGGQVYEFTIPAGSVQSGVLEVEVTCDGATTVSVAGEIQLYDPSGIVSDAVTGDPVVGAEVTLFKVPDWTPKTTVGAPGPEECETNESKDGAAWSQPAPTDFGVEVDPDAQSDEIEPDVNPFLTSPDGYYGWDVAEGCWYVEVAAEGYEPLTSPVVGVPTEVTDLDLELQPELSNTGKPSISGTPAVGESLKASAGTWAPPEAELAYQWLGDGTPISGATGTSYLLTAADYGSSISVRVTASYPGADDVAATSAATAAVAKGTMAMAKKPKIKGKSKVGKKLKAKAKKGAVSPSPAKVKYKWFVGKKKVKGKLGKKKKLELTPAMRGAKIKVKIIYKLPGYNKLKKKAKAKGRVS